MKRKPDKTPISTWEFFSACIHYLGKSSLTSVFQRGERQVQRWSANPCTTSSQQRNPVDRYEDVLKMLMETGQNQVAISCVARQAYIVGCELREKKMPTPDKPTLELEIIDDLSFKTAYDDILLDRKSTRKECLDALNNAIKELKENYVQKCKENGWEP